MNFKKFDVSNIVQNWDGEIAEECYSESGILEVAAVTWDDTRKQYYGVAVNGEIAYHSQSSEPASRVYNQFKRC